MIAVDPPRVAYSNPRHNGGFSLFELVAFIIVSAIIYSVAVNRFSEFPAAAERANFQAVLTQVQTGVSLETMLGLSTGSIRSMQDYVGLNPMELLLKPPSNYLGAFDALNVADAQRRSWYFDNRTRELVYLVNASENVFLLQNSVAVPTDELRFGIVMTYRDPISLKNVTSEELEALNEERSRSGADEPADSEQLKVRTSGVVLRPVTPYRWEGYENLAQDYVSAS